MKVGITGQPGFIGTHLANYLQLFPDRYTVVHWEDAFFSDAERLRRFVGECDAIVHLAAVNRHADANVIFDTNVGLVRQLITAMESAGVTPRVVFSSSIQEERDNPYGRSKLEGRRLLEEWSHRTGAAFTGLIIPNVFGPFGSPFYNSVVATFSHLLVTGGQPKIEVDATLPLIYVNELVEVFRQAAEGELGEGGVPVAPTSHSSVTSILSHLERFKTEYFDEGLVPALHDDFEVSLFNTFRSFIPMSHFPFKLQKRTDNRGFLVEAIRSRMGGQVFYSLTKPGITRGNHLHRRKVERFLVLSGQAIIRLRRIGTDEVFEFSVNGDEPAFVDMPVHYTHNITNTGSEDLITLFWTNEIFNPDDPDTWYEEV